MGRNTKNSDVLERAANSNRRSASARACVCHSRTAPHVLAFRICSADHSWSFEHFARNRRTCSARMTEYARPCAHGAHGGSTRATGAFSDPSAGASSRISPEPSACARTSVSAPIGHPPPGNSCDKTGYPVSTVDTRPRASCDARQSAG
jgi:hypothetical protein